MSEGRVQEIYSHRECVFNYCPTPQNCERAEGGCLHKMDAGCICARGEIALLGTPDPLCRAREHRGSKPSLSDHRAVLSVIQTVDAALRSVGHLHDRSRELQHATDRLQEAKWWLTKRYSQIPDRAEHD